MWSFTQPSGPPTSLHTNASLYAIIFKNAAAEGSAHSWYCTDIYHNPYPINHTTASLDNVNIGQVRLGGSIRSYVLYVQFWIRLAAVSYRGKKVRTVASPAVRSVNTSWHTQLRPKRARVGDLCHIHHSFILQSPRNNSVCSEMANTPQLQSSWQFHCDVTGHRKMSALGTTGSMVTTHENSVMMRSFKGPNFFSVF